MSTINDSLFITGTLTANAFIPPSGSINDGSVQAGAPGNRISATKLSHQHNAVYSDARATTAAAQRRVLHVANGPGSLVRFAVGAMVAALGDATVTVQLKKNGVNILSSPITLDSGDAAYVLVNAGGFISTTAVSNDVFEIDVTVAAGTGTLPTGFFCVLISREEPE